MIILLSSHDRFLSELYKKKFEERGDKVVLTHDGEATIDSAKKKQPDVILLDVILRSMDGFSVLQALKADAMTKHIPVAMLTSVGQKEDVDRGFSLGAKEYIISTHMSPDEVVQKIYTLIHS